MSKEEKKPVEKTAPKKETVPTSKPAAKKAAAPKAKASKAMQSKKAAKTTGKKDAKKDVKKDAKKTVKKDVKKDVKADAKKATKKVEKKDKKAEKPAKKEEKKPEKAQPAKTEQKTDAKKKPTLPAVVGIGKPKKAPKKAEKPDKKTSRKAPAELPNIMKQKEEAVEKVKAKKPKKQNPHFIARPKSFHIGGDLPPKRDLSRMVKWPKYIRLQRKKKIMYQRLKIPAMINQFTQTLDKHAAKIVFRLLKKYRPESPKSRKSRLLGMAKAKRAGKKIILRKPYVVKFGASHVTHLVEQKKAKLVLIANDVDPIEHVLFLPTLCRKMHVPYCIVKNKERLGRLVRMKTCTVCALTSVRPEDKIAFSAIRSMCKNSYNRQAHHIMHNIGGGKLGLKSSIALKKREEALKKASLEKAAA